jgi:hypothetical protein
LSTLLEFDMASALVDLASPGEEGEGEEEKQPPPSLSLPILLLVAAAGMQAGGRGGASTGCARVSGREKE